MTEDKLDFWGGFCLYACWLAWENFGPFWGTAILSIPILIIQGYDGDFYEKIIFYIGSPLIYGWCAEWVYLNI
jgi:hypothetical protein